MNNTAKVAIGILVLLLVIVGALYLNTANQLQGFFRIQPVSQPVAMPVTKQAIVAQSASCGSEWKKVFEGKAENGESTMEVSIPLSEESLQKLLRDGCSFKLVTENMSTDGASNTDAFECQYVQYGTSTNQVFCLGRGNEGEIVGKSLGAINGMFTDWFRINGETSNVNVAFFAGNKSNAIFREELLNNQSNKAAYKIMNESNFLQMLASASSFKAVREVDDDSLFISSFDCQRVTHSQATGSASCVSVKTVEGDVFATSFNFINGVARYLDSASDSHNGRRSLTLFKKP